MHTAYIALGANVASWAGSPAATLAAALTRLSEFGRVTRQSSLYSTEPVGFDMQPKFVNAVVALETDLEPRPLLHQLLEIEKKFGRDRSVAIPNGPRTLDLDILLVEEVEVNEPGLELPHPRLADRAFVLVPLNEIAPNLKIPGRDRTVAELLEALESCSDGGIDGVARIEVDGWQAQGNP